MDILLDKLAKIIRTIIGLIFFGSLTLLFFYISIQIPWRWWLGGSILFCGYGHWVGKNLGNIYEL